MATKLVSKQQLDYKEDLNLPINQIFVNTSLVLDGKKVKKSLNELFIHRDGKVKLVKTFKDYKDNLDYLSTSDNVPAAGRITKNSSPYFSKPFYEVVDIPQHFETTITLDSDTKIDGYKKYFEVLGSNTFKTDEYIMIFVEHSVKPQFLKLKDIMQIKNGKFQNLDAIADKSALVRLINNSKKDLYTRDGKLITSVYVERTFAFKKLKEETFNPDTLEKTTYSVSLDKNGNPTFSEQKIILDKKFSIHTHATLKVDDEKKPGETKDVSMLAIRTYNYDNSGKGKYVNLTIRGGVDSQPIAIEDIYTLDSDPKQIKNLSDYVGKVVNVKIGDGKFAETEVLTLDQVSTTYNTSKHYEPSRNVNQDAFADNSYVLLKSGKFIQESKAIQPICFNFAKSNAVNFDAYLAIVIEDGVEIPIVISKADFEKKYNRSSSSTFVFNGYTIDMTNVRKLSITNNVNKCDVVQTTNRGNSVERANVLSKIPADRHVELLATLETFKEDYKKGDYLLKQVWVEGKLEDIDTRHDRYVYTDVSYRENYADSKTEYVALDAKPFQYVSKDGELGKIQGGPQYNIGKGIASGLKTYGDVLGQGLSMMFSSVGILVALAAPVLAAAAAAVAVVAPVAIVAGNIGYGIAKNSFNKYKWSNQSKFNQKEWRKELEQELNWFYKQTKETKNKTLDSFTAECVKIDSMIDALIKAKVGEGFELKDGKIDINSHNVHAVTTFMRDAKVENKILKGKTFGAKRQASRIIKKLSKKSELTESEKLELEQAKKQLEQIQIVERKRELEKVSKLDIKQQQELASLEVDYDRLEKTFKDKMTNYKAEPEIVHPDAKSKKLIKVAENLKAFLYVKHFATDLTKSHLDDKSIELLSDIEYDFETNSFVYKGKKLSFNSGVSDATIYSGDILSDEDKAVAKTIQDIKKLMKLEEVKLAVNPNSLLEEVESLDEPDEITPASLETEEEKIEEEKTEDRHATYDSKINSEDRLVVLLKAKTSSKDRIKLLEYIKSETGLALTEDDINQTIKRIDAKHLVGKSATSGSATLKNKAINLILTYGQEYLTRFAKDIKERTSSGGRSM